VNEIETDVLVLGGGVAGLTVARGLAGHRRVVLVEAGPGSTPWAQGGIAVVIDPADDPADHAADTATAGVGVCDDVALAVLAEEGPAAVAALLRAGARFDRAADGRLALGLEGGHHRRRVVHAGIRPDDVRRQVAEHPGAELLVHPECGCATSALWLSGEGELPAARTRILSTGGMVDAARTTTAETVLVATEVGMLHQLRKVNDRAAFLPMNPQACCRYMKMTTPELLLRALREGRDEVTVDPAVAAKARRAVERMIAIGTPGGGE